MDHEIMLMEDCAEDFDSFLELLCEDGFLTPEEILNVETQEEEEALIRRAMERGFPTLLDEERLDAAVKLILKKLDSLRIWRDLVDDDFHLRAPPEVCAD